VIMGCVLPAGLGQAPARQAAMLAGIREVGAGHHRQQDVRLGHEGHHDGRRPVRAGDATVVAAGGLESMSNAPYLLPKARSGYRMGHGELLDHMFTDGLQSPGTAR
jgi:acetyl-CoA C-acetyltransferase